MNDNFDTVVRINLVKYMLSKFPDGVEYVKLMKLLFLAEIRSLRTCGESIFGDDERYIAMQYGPVLSNIKNLIEADAGYLSEEVINTIEENWNVPPSSRPFTIMKIKNTTDMQYVSDFDKACMDAVFETYGAKSAQKLIDITHEFSEWKKYEKALADPTMPSAYPISKEAFLEINDGPEMGDEKIIQAILAVR